MKAFQVSDHTEPAKLTEIQSPTPGPGEVLVEIAACGLNFADLLMANGQYQEIPPLPFTMGLEISGTVTALGPDTTRLRPGDRVAVFGGAGGLAEYGCFSESQCLSLPDNMPFAEAAGFQVAYGTSHLALFHRAQVTASDTVLILGAAGGVGLTAVELAKHAGARVIAVARGPEKCEIAAMAGADHVIDSNQGDFRDQVKTLGGVDVVFDPVGGDPFKSALRVCKPEARVIVIGFASGVIPQIPANILLVKNLTIIGLYWGAYLKFSPETLRQSLAELLAIYADGKLHPHISAVFPLEDAADALELLQSRRSTGKVIVTLRPELLTG